MTTIQAALGEALDTDPLSVFTHSLARVRDQDVRRRLAQAFAQTLLDKDLLTLEELERVLRSSGLLHQEMDPRHMAMFKGLPAMPTVANGMKQLGMNSLLDWYFDNARIRSADSPYSHWLQRPYFFIPGLRARAVWDTNEFPWVKDIEAAYPEIREEYLRQERLSRGLVSTYRGDDFYGRVVTTDGLLSAEQAERTGTDPSWLNVPFLEPAPNRRVQELFPATWRAIDAVPRLNRTSIATFSSLEPNSVIPSHCGPINGNLRVHLCIDDSPNAFIRVGEEVIDWQEGKVVIFDDAFEHHVVHRGPKRRTVLLFDVWHPDWSPRELSILNSQTPSARSAA